MFFCYVIFIKSPPSTAVIGQILTEVEYESPGTRNTGCKQRCLNGNLSAQILQWINKWIDAQPRNRVLKSEPINSPCVERFLTEIEPETMFYIIRCFMLHLQVKQPERLIQKGYHRAIIFHPSVLPRRLRHYNILGWIYLVLAKGFVSIPS